MNSEKRFFIAVAISFLILILYPVYLKWVSPPQPVTRPAPELLASEQKPENRAIAEAAPSQAVPVTPAVSESIQKLSHKHFDAEFSTKGGAIKRLALKSWGKNKNGGVILIERDKKPGAFAVKLPGQGIDLESQVLTLKHLDEIRGEIQFAFEDAGKWRLTKKFRFDEEKPVIWLDVEVENIGLTENNIALELTADLDIISTKTDASFQPEAFVSLRDKLISTHLSKFKKKPQITEGEILWQVLRRHYFSVIVRPDVPAILSKVTAEYDGHEYMHSSLRLAEIPVKPGQILKREILIYAGPEYYKELKAFGHGFEHILSNGVFGIFKFWLLVALQWVYGIVRNYGWAIIIITCAIKLLFTPLTHISFESMKKMQALQPKLKALQEKHKGDQAKLSQEMMELYKKNKVNPMSGCLPMLLQIPVFIAFYQVLAQTVEFKGEPFIFWIRDLSEPDRFWTLPFSIPFLGDAINILPVLMLGSMIWQQKLTPQTGSPEQQKIMMIMPIVFGFIFYSLPSGLVLYWFINNMLSIFHQLFIKGKALPHHEEA